MSTAEKPMYEWNTIPWKRFEKKVFKLQKRIYRASRRGDVRTVRRLQRLLLKSWSAKCLATRRVTQDNRGKKTAGVDGKKSLTPKQRLQLVSTMKLQQKAPPVRRIWIPKPGKQEKRPLGIPTIATRAQQTLVKLALEPEWEAKFEANSYGFRPGRSAHDAIEAIFSAICQAPQYVWDADIEKCFDRIEHKALLKKLNTFPHLQRTIKGWLKAGVMEGEAWSPSEAGSPQGGTISPLLMNIALHGLETTITSAFPEKKIVKGVRRRWRAKIVRYADDLVILHPDLETVKRAKEIAEGWLKGIGLQTKEEKSRITHTLEKHEGNVGFDFLGFEVRQYPSTRKYGFKTIIKPSKEAVQRHSQKIKEILRKKQNLHQQEIIRMLNPLIRGWANYYSTVVSKQIFSKLGHLTWIKLWRWAVKKNPKTGKRKVKKKYWREGWKFKTETGYELQRHSSIPIVRHTKVKVDKSPYDGDFVYWATRLGRDPILPRWKARLLKSQKGRCNKCGALFKHGDIMEIDHVVPLSAGGKRQRNNLQLLHGHCHDTKTAQDKTKERCR